MTDLETTVAAAPPAPAKDSPLTGAMRAIERLLEAAGDRLNPLLVKETRQALKSRQFTLWFALLLVACWVITVGGVALIGPSVLFVSAGPYLLRAYYAVLALPLVVVVPFAAYRSLAMEQDDNTRDLLEVSSLTPRQMINGKLGSAALQATLFLAAVAPCIAFTYLLRGIDATTIILVLAYAIFASLGLSMLGLLVASATRQKGGQVLLSVLLAGGLFSALWAVLGIANAVLTFELGLRNEVGFWQAHAAFACLYATTFAVAYQAAVGLSTFASANRSTGVRVALVVQQAVFLGWIVGVIWSEAVPVQVAAAGMVIASVYWFVAGAAMTGEQPTLSQRVRRTLPQSALGRALGAWFSPGPAAGYVFAVANAAVATAVCCGVSALLLPGGFSWFASVNSGPELGGVVLLGYLAVYLGLGRFAIIGLRRFAPVSVLGCFLVQLLIALACNGLPYVIETMNDRIRVANYSVLQAPSLVWVGTRVANGGLSATQESTIVASVVTVGAAIFLVNLMLAGIEQRQSRVAAPRRVVEDDLELNPPPAPRVTSPWGDVERGPGPEAIVAAGDG
ncbi:MAG: hypothetical protein ACRCT8_02995 [Lacipirellulaceae bacterium]